MRRRWIFLAPLFFLAFLAFLALGGWAISLLWNWLLPPLFGFRQITFWQALGLLALCRLLFGGHWMRTGHRSHMRRRMEERWGSMPPEEREACRQRMRSRWGFGPPAAGASEKGTTGS